MTTQPPLIKHQRDSYPEGFQKIWTFAIRHDDRNKADTFKHYQQALKRGNHTDILQGVRAWHKDKRTHPTPEKLRTVLRDDIWKAYLDQAPAEKPAEPVEALSSPAVNDAKKARWQAVSEQMATYYERDYRGYLRHLTLVPGTGVVLQARSRYERDRVRNEYADIIGRYFGEKVDVI